MLKINIYDYYYFFFFRKSGVVWEHKQKIKKIINIEQNKNK